MAARIPEACTLDVKRNVKASCELPEHALSTGVMFHTNAERLQQQQQQQRQLASTAHSHCHRPSQPRRHHQHTLQ